MATQSHERKNPVSRSVTFRIVKEDRNAEHLPQGLIPKKKCSRGQAVPNKSNADSSIGHLDDDSMVYVARLCNL
jgi:hypothetical protein